MADMADWYGVELDQPLGRHDGTVQGVSLIMFSFGNDASFHEGAILCSGEGSWSICDAEQADQAGQPPPPEAADDDLVESDPSSTSSSTS